MAMSVSGTTCGSMQDSGTKVQLSTANDITTDLVDADKQSNQAKQEEADKARHCWGSAVCVCCLPVYC